MNCDGVHALQERGFCRSILALNPGIMAEISASHDGEYGDGRLMLPCAVSHKLTDVSKVFTAFLTRMMVALFFALYDHSLETVLGYLT